MALSTVDANVAAIYHSSIVGDPKMKYHSRWAFFQTQHDQLPGPCRFGTGIESFRRLNPIWVALSHVQAVVQHRSIEMGHGHERIATANSGSGAQQVGKDGDL